MLMTQVIVTQNPAVMREAEITYREMFLSFEAPVSFPGDSGALGVVSRVKSFFSLIYISSQCFVFSDMLQIMM